MQRVMRTGLSVCIALLAAAVGLACGGDSAVRTPHLQDTKTLYWVTGTPTEREGALLTVRIGSTNVRVDLSQSAVFDCRLDCLKDVKEALAPFSGGESVCLYVDDESRGARILTGKIWINRYTCEGDSPAKRP